MSNYNDASYTEDSIATTRAWLRRTCPLVYLYGPSATGKTTLISSLFRHPLYTEKPILYIDGDDGTATIAEYVYSPELCDLHRFDLDPSQYVAWFISKFRLAKQADCGAIVIEGLTALHASLVADKMMDITSDAEGPAAMRAHVPASNRLTSMVAFIRTIKRAIVARKAGVPIIVTLNTRETPSKLGDFQAPKVITPDWSRNLNEKAMRTADAFLEMQRSAGGTLLLTRKDDLNAFRKLRACVPFSSVGKDQPDAARLVQRQRNLHLPGLFGLWAAAEEKMRSKIDALTQPQ